MASLDGCTGLLAEHGDAWFAAWRARLQDVYKRQIGQPACPPAPALPLNNHTLRRFPMKPTYKQVTKTRYIDVYKRQM